MKSNTLDWDSILYAIDSIARASGRESISDDLQEKIVEYAMEHSVIDIGRAGELSVLCHSTDMVAEYCTISLNAAIDKAIKKLDEDDLPELADALEAQAKKIREFLE